MLTKDAISEFAEVEPVLKRCENRGWLAVSPDGALCRIGVFAWHVDNAKYEWDKARDAWVSLLEDILRDPDWTRRPAGGAGGEG